MDFFKIFKKIKDIEDIQAYSVQKKKPELRFGKEDKEKLEKAIQDIKNVEFKEEENELERLNKEIEYNELKRDILLQENIEKQEEIDRIKYQINEYEKLINDTDKSFESQYKDIEEAYHEVMLKNIERRNYMQKLKLLKFENTKRKSKGRESK